MGWPSRVAANVIDNDFVLVNADCSYVITFTFGLIPLEKAQTTFPWLWFK